MAANVELIPNHRFQYCSDGALFREYCLRNIDMDGGLRICVDEVVTRISSLSSGIGGDGLHLLLISLSCLMIFLIS